MKSFLVLTISIFLLKSCTNKHLTVDRVWDNYINEIVNKRSINKVQTLHMRSITYYDTDTAVENLYVVVPDRMRYELVHPIQGATTIIYNNGQGVSIVGQDTTVLDEEVLNKTRENTLIFPEVYYKELGWNITEAVALKEDTNFNIYVSKESGDNVYVFTPDGKRVICVKSVKYDLETKIDSLTQIDGINFIGKNYTITGKDTSVTYHEYDLNLELDNSMFRIEN